MEKHPERFQIEVDRISLKTYLNYRFAGTWAGLLCFITLIGIAIALGPVSNSEYLKALQIVGGTFIGSLVLCGIGFITLTIPRIRRVVRDTELWVEGVHLRVKTYELASGQWHDRKLHFKVIVDYDVVEDRWMRRFGIQTLCLHTTGGGVASTISIPGVKDCSKMRDTLTELDCERENQ